MSKKLQLTIPKPCHENWDNMTPVQQGKFCGSCQKQVVDFSDMSDRQVAEFFKKPTTGSVCGRFMTDQLEREIEIPKKRIPWLKYFFQFAIPAFLISIKVSAGKSQGKIIVKTVTSDTIKVPVREQLVTMGTPLAIDVCIKPLMCDSIITPVKYPVELIKGEISNISNEQRKSIINGKVIDEKGDPLPGTIVSNKGTRIWVFADSAGQFRIIAKTGNTLVLQGAGLEMTEAVVGESNSISITVKRLIIGRTIAGFVVNKMKPKKNIENVPLMKQVSNYTVSKSFNIFPNPVQSGSSLNIEWNQTEEGYYSLQLLNQSGQSVYQ